MIGTVKVVNSNGYGFITAQGGIDFFFHYKDFYGDWKKLTLDFVRQGAKKIEVQFENDNTATDGPRAINVRLMNGS